MEGMTLLADVFGASLKALTSHEIATHFLTRCVEEIGMKPLPHTLKVEHFPLIDGSGGFGLSGLMILVESHIAIHTWPERRYARVEISSCRRFDAKKAINVLRAFFGGNTIWEVVFWRGEDECKLSGKQVDI